MNSKIKVGILGADGSMGRFISRLVIEDADLVISHAYTIPDSPKLGTDIGILVGRPKQGVEIVDIAQLESDLEKNPPDVIIDFTIAKGTEENSPKIISHKVPLVIGTTGMSDSFYSSFPALCLQHKVSSVLATNMAIGVNIFFKIAQEITKYLKDWDIEVIESHHHRKRDSPTQEFSCRQ